MDQPSFSEFEAAARRDDDDEVIARDWPAYAAVAEHEHPFAVKALVVAGEMWLSEGDATRHLRPGDTFELAAAAPHAQRDGAAGATYWAARRHANR